VHGGDFSVLHAVQPMAVSHVSMVVGGFQVAHIVGGRGHPMVSGSRCKMRSGCAVVFPMGLVALVYRISQRGITCFEIYFSDVWHGALVE
jgi:hypothetical protein